ncbi:MAG: endolytic transglycosylase MltG [Eubacteriales bacterium]
MKNSKMLKTAVISLVVISTLVIAAIIYYIFSLTPMDVDGKAKLVEIPPGYTLKMISEKLANEEIIKSKITFEIYVKSKGAANALKAGKYLFSSEYDVNQIVQDMREGNVVDESIAVTFPEGLTLQQMADELEQNGFSREDFLKETGDIHKYQQNFDFLQSITNSGERTLEGYLFPDTYYFYKEDTGEKIVQRMLSRFDEVLKDDYLTQAEALNRTLDEIVIMASIVEQESKFDEDRPNVAGVFYNRLKKGMHLQSDVTVLYALGVKKEQVLYKDLEVDSKYNTYKYAGLPIGPIGSFGEASLKAALSPSKHDYYYFIAKKDGYCVFTKTLQEHNEVVQQYLR